MSRDAGLGRPTGSAIVRPTEKLVCEREARHDVAARGRQADPAGALRRYLTHARVDEELRHQRRHSHRWESAAARRARARDDFVAQHPLTASWLRWGEDPP
jgi:hypothetical protein